MRVDFTVHADNEASVALPLREVRYSLRLDDERVFDGFRSPEVTVPAEGSIEFMLPVALRFDEEPSGLRPYRLSATVTYLAPGPLAETLFESEFRRPTVTVRDEGQIDFGASGS